MKKLKIFIAGMLLSEYQRLLIDEAIFDRIEKLTKYRLMEKTANKEDILIDINTIKEIQKIFHIL